MSDLFGKAEVKVCSTAVGYGSPSAHRQSISLPHIPVEIVQVARIPYMRQIDM
jgi:hypothetical protein